MVLNAVEDLRHDYEYFIQQAQKTPPESRKTMFLHQRWLRAAAFSFLAYVEAEVNRFVFKALEKRKAEFLFSRVERDTLEKNLELLETLTLTTTGLKRLNIQAVKELRNLWVHTKPESEEKAFENLKLDVIVEASREFQRWVSEAEKSLGIKRHSESKKLARRLSKGGRTIESAGSKSRHFRRSAGRV